VEVIILLVLACVLRATAKKRSSAFPEKILAMPMALAVIKYGRVDT